MSARRGTLQSGKELYLRLHPNATKTPVERLVAELRRPGQRTAAHAQLQRMAQQGDREAVAALEAYYADPHGTSS